MGGVRANLYFLSLYIIGPIILLNLFLAILLKNFDGDMIDEEDESQEKIAYEDLTFIEKAWLNTQEFFRGCFKKKDDTVQVAPSINVSDDHFEVRMVQVVKDGMREKTLELITSDNIKQSFSET